jgi:hypothetical protein
MLNNREWASLFWLAVLAGFLAYKRVLGPILRPFFHAFVRPPIVGPIIALSCYTVGLVYVGYRSGIWTTDVLKDTVLWFLVAGLPFVFGISGSAKRGYLARAAVGSIQVTALLEFYLNLFVFNIWVEIVLAPLLLLLLTVPLVVQANESDAAEVVRFTNIVSGVIGFGALVYVSVKLIRHRSEIADIETLRSFALPVWLMLGSLPFAYILSLWVNYGGTFALVDVATDDRRARRQVKIALLTTLHVRSAAAGSFRWPWIPKARDAASFRQTRGVVKDYLRTRTRRREEGEDKGE